MTEREKFGNLTYAIEIDLVHIRHSMKIAVCSILHINIVTSLGIILIVQIKIVVPIYNQKITTRLEEMNPIIVCPGREDKRPHYIFGNDNIERKRVQI